MYSVNFVQILLCLMASGIIFMGSLVNVFESKLPCLVSQTFRYGKYSFQGKKSKFAIEVPKSSFKHFYVLAFILYTYLIILLTMVYIVGWNAPDHIIHILNVVCGENRVVYTPKIKVYISVGLMTIQVYRRFYETQQISVFGKNSKINMSHYVVGMLHYPLTALAILSEAPLFADSPSDIKRSEFNLSSMQFCDYLTVLLFLVAWKHQFICTKILGDLRKNENGNVVTSDYKIPQGDWFEYLSAPHQTTEIIMYSCIMWLLWNNISWFFVFIWVLVNQVETILLSHWWYQEKFDDFPKKRRALIPFIY